MASAGLLGAVEGLAFAKAFAPPTMDTASVLVAAVRAASAWALLVALLAAAAAPLALVAARRIRSLASTDPGAIGGSIGLTIGLVVPVLLTVNHELLPGIRTTTSLVWNAVFLVASVGLAIGIGGLLGKRPPRPRLGAAFAALIVAAVCYFGTMHWLSGLQSWSSAVLWAQSATGGPVPTDEDDAASSTELKAPRNVLFVLIDATRADHLSCYGYKRATSPNMDAFARSATVFTSAISQQMKTSPSVASLYTGTYPHTHGLTTAGEWLDQSAVTVAEVLSDNGFHTVSVTANPNPSTEFNFDQGFDHMEEVFREKKQDAEVVTDRALNQLELAVEDGRPFFIYLHYNDPHTLYTPPAPYHEMFVGDDIYRSMEGWKLPMGGEFEYRGHVAENVALRDSGHVDEVAYYHAEYDAEIRYADAQVGRLLRELEHMGLAEDTLVVLTADHGESFGEHNLFFQHGRCAYQENAYVPLMIRVPGSRQVSRVNSTVENFSTMPTILELLHLEVPRQVEARSLVELLSPDAEEQPERVGFSEGSTDPNLIWAIRRGRWKLLWNWHERPAPVDAWSVTRLPKRDAFWRNKRKVEWELYDLSVDPDEQSNVIDQHPEVVVQLKPALIRWVASAPRSDRHWARRPSDRPEDEGVRKQLRDLGYAQ